MSETKLVIYDGEDYSLAHHLYLLDPPTVRACELEAFLSRGAPSGSFDEVYLLDAERAGAEAAQAVVAAFPGLRPTLFGRSFPYREFERLSGRAEFVQSGPSRNWLRSENELTPLLGRFLFLCDEMAPLLEKLKGHPELRSERGYKVFMEEATARLLRGPLEGLLRNLRLIDLEEVEFLLPFAAPDLWVRWAGWPPEPQTVAALHNFRRRIEREPEAIRGIYEAYGRWKANSTG
jgi:hypothetical protein